MPLGVAANAARLQLEASGNAPAEAQASLYEKTFSQMPSEASLQPRWSTLEYSIANDELALPGPVP